MFWMVPFFQFLLQSQAEKKLSEFLDVTRKDILVIHEQFPQIGSAGQVPKINLLLKHF